MKHERHESTPIAQRADSSLKQFVTIRGIGVFVAIVASAISYDFSYAQESPAPANEPTSISLDKKWEVVAGESPKLVKADTKEVAIDFSEQSDLEVTGQELQVLWAPDSRRVAFYSRGAGKEHNTLLYQLRADRWVALEAPRDELFERVGAIVEAQAKRKGLPKKTFLHMQWWRVELRQWLNPSTLIVHASMAERVHRPDSEDVGLFFGADLLFTLKFDDTGNWEIIKTREMTGKAAGSPSLSSPLAEKVLFRSPGGSYQIQASADGTALWIVPAKDPNQRKPLRDADPDNRSPEEFSGSLDDTWLFDNRQHELYRDTGNLAFALFNGKQWFWKTALGYASKEFHFPRRDVGTDSAGWSFDSARLLIDFETGLSAGSEVTPQHRFFYFNTRTKAFEQTPYLRMVNTKLNTEKPYEAFPRITFAQEHRDSYAVFAEPISPPPSEESLKARLAALEQEMQALREKQLADIARKDSKMVEFTRSENDGWNKARDEAMQLYLPFAPKDGQQSLRLQFLCDLTQREVNGLREVVPSTASDQPAAQSPSRATSPP